MRLYLFYIGKARDEHAHAMAEEFIKRSSRYLACEMREIHPQRYDLFHRHGSAQKVFCDPAGQPFDSARFTRLVAQAEQEARDVVFLIGAHDGLPAEWRPRADLLLSLSPLTLPHELARVLLAEQIYRALTTLRGHPYPR